MNHIIIPSKKAVLIDQVRKYVLEQYNEYHSAKYVYHNYQLTVELVKQVQALAIEEQTTEEEEEWACIAAWFVKLGYLLDYNAPTFQSQLEAKRYLQKINYPEASMQKVLDTILVLRNSAIPRDISAKILHDALVIVELFQNFEERSALRKLELELVQQEQTDRRSWQEKTWNKLLEAKLFTYSAKNKYDTILSLLVQEQKEVMMKKPLKAIESTNPNKDRRFASIEKKAPARGVQTFFRSNYRNHINLSAIADNKANIMISVNSILISVLLSALTYRNITESSPMVLLPAIIFLMTGLTSLIFAVLSARPKVTALNNPQMNLHEIKKNIIFFGNFSALELDQYEEAMDQVLNDSELLYGNMSRDLYFLGKVLDKKYRYLTVSYNVFMVGFIATVCCFLLLMLVAN